MSKYVPIYVDWKYGNGSVGSFMCDLSGIWSEEFMCSDVGCKIVLNIISSLIAKEQLI